MNIYNRLAEELKDSNRYIQQNNKPGVIQISLDLFQSLVFDPILLEVAHVCEEVHFLQQKGS